MKLKYYLRGMGIGIILTAIVMGFALGGRRGTLSDAEIIKRAKALGMVEQSSGTLSASLKEEIITNENDASSSGETLDQEGKEISEEEHPLCLVHGYAGYCWHCAYQQHSGAMVFGCRL